MTVEEALVNLLLSSPAVTAAVASRIYPQQAEQGAAYPHIIYSMADRLQEMTLTGPINLNAGSLALEIVSRSYRTAKNLAKTLRTLLNGYRGDLESGAVTILGVFDNAEDDGAESPQFADEFGLHRVDMNLSIHFGE